MINFEFFIREFPFLYLLITFGFLLNYKMKDYKLYKVGALLLLQLLPIFIIDLLLILSFKINYKEIVYQIVFIILPYTTIMFIFLSQNAKFKNKNKNR